MAGMTITDAMVRRRSCRSFADREISKGQLETLFWAGYGITSEAGQRTVPSAHALYPLKYYVAACRVEDLDPGLYSVEDCRLGDLIRSDAGICAELCDAALEDQPWVAEAAVVIAVCADFGLAIEAFAEQPPEGQRGIRYVYLEAGAAMQNMQLSAVAEGLGSVPVAGFDDGKVADALLLPGRLSPVFLLCAG